MKIANHTKLGNVLITTTQTAYSICSLLITNHTDHLLYLVITPHQVTNHTDRLLYLVVLNLI